MGALQVDNQKAVLARDRAAPNITANVWFYVQFVVSMLLKREDLVPWADQSAGRRLARRIIEDKWFNRFVMTIVFVNIIAMALYHAEMSHGFAAALEVTPFMSWPQHSVVSTVIDNNVTIARHHANMSCAFATASKVAPPFTLSIRFLGVFPCLICHMHSQHL